MFKNNNKNSIYFILNLHLFEYFQYNLKLVLCCYTLNYFNMSPLMYLNITIAGLFKIYFINMTLIIKITVHTII